MYDSYYSIYIIYQLEPTKKIYIYIYYIFFFYSKKIIIIIIIFFIFYYFLQNSLHFQKSLVKIFLGDISTKSVHFVQNKVKILFFQPGLIHDNSEEVGQFVWIQWIVLHKHCTFSLHSFINNRHGLIQLWVDIFNLGIVSEFLWNIPETHITPLSFLYQFEAVLSLLNLFHHILCHLKGVISPFPESFNPVSLQRQPKFEYISSSSALQSLGSQIIVLGFVFLEEVGCIDAISFRQQILVVVDEHD